MHALSIQKSLGRFQRCLKISSFVAWLCVSSAAPAQSPADPVAKMTVEQKVGQLMIWTFGGTEFNSQVAEMVRKYQLGSLIVFSRNISTTNQIARFNRDARKFSSKNLKAPLFLMIDQEGGAVSRIKLSSPLPSALALGRTEDPKFIEAFAKTKAEFLLSLGFNMNLAPVLDLSSPETDTFIANRSFGDAPERVSELAVAYARGLHAGGVIPTAKHFPGHGGHVGDSHQGSTKKLATWEELEKRDLVPFVGFAQSAFPRAMMMAHLSVPKIDESGVPATYSRILIEEKLRGQLGYDGLVMTDDLEMDGASISADIGERAVRAFLAGNDLLMFAGHPKNQKRAFEALVTAVKEERIPMQRLNQSVSRVLGVKRGGESAKFIPDGAKTKILRAKLEDLSREVMLKNFRAATEGKTTALHVSPGTPVEIFASDQRFFKNFRSVFTGTARFTRISPAALRDLSTKLQKMTGAALIFYASGTTTAKWLAKLAPDIRARLIVVNCNNAGQIENQESYRAVLNLNSASPESGGWLAVTMTTEPAPAELREPADVGEPIPENQ